MSINSFCSKFFLSCFLKLLKLSLLYFFALLFLILLYSSTPLSIPFDNSVLEKTSFRTIISVSLITSGKKMKTSFLKRVFTLCEKLVHKIRLRTFPEKTFFRSRSCRFARGSLRHAVCCICLCQSSLNTYFQDIEAKTW